MKISLRSSLIYIAKNTAPFLSVFSRNLHFHKLFTKSFGLPFAPDAVPAPCFKTASHRSRTWLVHAAVLAMSYLIRSVVQLSMSFEGRSLTTLYSNFSFFTTFLFVNVLWMSFPAPCAVPREALRHESSFMRFGEMSLSYNKVKKRAISELFRESLCEFFVDSAWWSVRIGFGQLR